MPRARSDFIRQQREELGLSQLNLALEADMGVRTVQLAESAKDRNSSNRTLRAIARVLGVDYQEVLYFDGDGDTDEGQISSDRDAFQAWPWSLSDFISGRATLPQSAYCESVEDARFAVHSMRTSWSKHLERSQSHHDDNQFAQADVSLNHEYEVYEDRYLQIWKENPSTIIFATSEQQRVGVCVVLPVTKKAYDNLRKGELSFMEISAADVLPESQYLILDSAVELPCTNASQLQDATYSLSFALFYQIALLSENPVAESFRMVGFGASPINLQRLEGIGFSACGVEMPSYGFQVCEFAIEDDIQSEDAFKRSITTLHYTNLFKIFSLSSASPSQKRKMIRKALRLYQRIAKTHVIRIRKDQDGSAA